MHSHGTDHVTSIRYCVDTIHVQVAADTIVVASFCNCYATRLPQLDHCTCQSIACIIIEKDAKFHPRLILAYHWIYETKLSQSFRNPQISGIDFRNFHVACKRVAKFS
jgi:hypothetical protein